MSHKHKAKYEHGQEVFYWNEEKKCAIKGTIVFIYEEYLDGDFIGFSYIISTLDKPLPLDISRDAAWKYIRYDEDILFDSYYVCLDAEYNKEEKERNWLKDELRKSEEKLKLITMLRGY